MKLNTKKFKVKISINILIQHKKYQIFLFRNYSEQRVTIDQISASWRWNYIVSLILWILLQESYLF